MAALEITVHANITPKQKKILKSTSDFLILTGVAGTSKTYLALVRGLQMLKTQKVDKVVIIRSAVEIRNIGFLPGNQQEKLEAYMGPYIGLVNEISPKRNFKALMSSKDIEFHSTSFLRGLTFDNAFIIVDEYQNMNAHELETIVTRVGVNTQMVLCGDSDQTDLKNGESKEHAKIIDVLESMPDFEVYTFGTEDIVRSAFVKRYYEAKSGVVGVELLNRVLAKKSPTV